MKIPEVIANAQINQIRELETMDAFTTGRIMVMEGRKPVLVVAKRGPGRRICEVFDYSDINRPRCLFVPLSLVESSHLSINYNENLGALLVHKDEKDERGQDQGEVWAWEKQRVKGGKR